MCTLTHTLTPPVISVGCLLSIVEGEWEQDEGIKGGGRSPTVMSCEPTEKKEMGWHSARQTTHCMETRDSLRLFVWNGIGFLSALDYLDTSLHRETKALFTQRLCNIASTKTFSVVFITSSAAVLVYQYLNITFKTIIYLKTCFGLLAHLSPFLTLIQLSFWSLAASALINVLLCLPVIF